MGFEAEGDRDGVLVGMEDMRVSALIEEHRGRSEAFKIKANGLYRPIRQRSSGVGFIDIS